MAETNGWKVKIGDHPEKVILESTEYPIIRSWDDAVAEYKRQLKIYSHEGPITCEYVDNNIQVTPKEKSFVSNTKPEKFVSNVKSEK